MHKKKNNNSNTFLALIGDETNKKIEIIYKKITSKHEFEFMVNNYRDDNKMEFFDNKDKGRKASLIFGPDKVQALHDVYKSYLINNNLTTQDNPLAISHVISNKNNRRYDHIYCNDNWVTIKVCYPYNNSIKATSDHSSVIGDLHKDNNT